MIGNQLFCLGRKQAFYLLMHLKQRACRIADDTGRQKCKPPRPLQATAMALTRNAVDCAVQVVRYNTDPSRSTSTSTGSPVAPVPTDSTSASARDLPLLWTIQDSTPDGCGTCSRS